jgi:acetyl-CoA carboxylase beta subunit
VNINGENVHVSMPRAQIFDIVIDENSIKVYNESDNAFNPIKIQDYNKALMNEKETMSQDAIKQGLLNDANRQAELAIKSLLEEMGFKNIDITTEIIIPELH